MKTLKIIGISVITIVALVFIFDLGYLVNGVSKTYLKGFKGPNIYDLDYFPSQPLSPANNKTDFYPLSASFTDVFPAEYADTNGEINTEYFSVSQGDSLLFEFQTEENREQKVSNSFSMAKSFTSLCAAKAIELGYIKSWTEPIQKYLPELDPALGKQGIANFLGMCSGLEWSESGANPFSDNAKAYYGDNLNGLVSGKGAITSEIGKYQYKSGNTQIAAMVIEKSTGQNLPDFFASHFWKKTATNTAFWGKDKEEGHAKAYCCVYAEGRDFHRLGQVLLDSGKVNGQQLIRTDLLQNMFSPFADSTTLGEKNELYGIGFWLDNYKGHDIIYARGILGQYIILVPDLDMVICRLGKKRMALTDKHHPKDLYLYLDFALSIL
jgi:CubicO group peptidase (beta-lactamase class C family)